MNPFAIYDKAKKVLESCKTADQLACAEKFVDRADKLLSGFGKSEFAKEARNSLIDIHYYKKSELAPRKPDSFFQAMQLYQNALYGQQNPFGGIL